MVWNAINGLVNWHFLEKTQILLCVQVIETVYGSCIEVINICALQTNVLTVYVHQLDRALAYSSQVIVELITPLLAIWHLIDSVLCSINIKPNILLSNIDYSLKGGGRGEGKGNFQKQFLPSKKRLKKYHAIAAANHRAVTKSREPGIFPGYYKSGPRLL